MRHRAFSTVIVLAGILAACGDEQPITVGAPPATPPPVPAGAPAANAPDAGEEEDAGELRIDAGPIFDDMFVEAEQNRDPFRNFGKLYIKRVVAPTAPARNVVMSGLSVDQMRLMAIISGVTSPMAMIVDQSGLGHFVRRGDYIGQAEIVQTGGEDGLQMQVNWRIERIRADEVVLVREDPNNPTAMVTRVLALYPEGDPARGTGWSGGYIPNGPVPGAPPGAPGTVPPGGFTTPGTVPPGGYVTPGAPPSTPAPIAPTAPSLAPMPPPGAPTGTTAPQTGAGGVYTIPVITPAQPPPAPATP